MKTSPSRAGQAVRDAERQLARGRIDDAVRTLAKALARDRNDAAVRASLARAAVLLGRPDDAARLLEGVDAAPELSCALALARGDVEAALEVTDGAAGPGVRYWRAHALYAAGRFDEACTEVNAAIEAVPDEPSFFHASGSFERAADRPGAAVSAFKRALELDRERPDTYAALADLLCLVGEAEAARDVARLGVQTLPDDLRVWRVFAAVALYRGDPAEVVYGLGEVVRIDPSERNYLDLAAFALAAGDAETAVRALDVLLAAIPESAEGRRFRAMFLDAADRSSEATMELRLAIGRAPNDWRPLNDLGCLLNTTRDPEAVAVLTRAVDLAPDEEIAPRYNLVLALLNAEKHDDAKKAARAIVERFGEDPLAKRLAAIA